MTTAAASAGVAFLVIVAAHALVFHFTKVSQVVRMIAVLTLAGAPSAWVAYPVVESLGLDAALPIEHQVAFTAAVIFVFLGYFYVQGYFVILMSITASMLTALARPNGAGREVLRPEPLEGVLRDRLRAMEDKGLLTGEGEGADRVYVASWRCLFYGSMFGRVKRFLNLGDGG